MRKFMLIVVASLSLTLGLFGSASAAPSHFPENPKACVGHSSTTANAAYQSQDPDKFRADQAHGEYGTDNQQGRRDDVQDIFNEPRCNPDSDNE